MGKSLTLSLQKKKKKRKRERERVESFAFISVDIQSKLLNFEQTTISAAQKMAKTLVSYVSHKSHRKIEIIVIFKFLHKT
jgi:hypothetical protein